MRALKPVVALLVVGVVMAPSAFAHGGPGHRDWGRGDRWGHRHHGGGGGGGGNPTPTPTVTLVAQGLDSPRHLAFGWGGDLFIAEAGRGGDGPCFTGGEGPACMGSSGAVTKVDRWGRQTRIADGLASYANTPTDENAIGPHGITVLGEDGVIITNGGPTEPKDATGATILRETLAKQNPVADLFGRVLAIGRRGKIAKLADIWDFERDNNPDAAAANPAIDSNPVDVALDGFKLVVADAGGNAVDVVRPWGRVSALSIFANRPAVPGGPVVQAVPTSVVVGPDHQYYVSQLTGFPFVPGAANIYKVDPRTGAQTVLAGGFTNLMDLAFGRDGTLYALSIDDNGLLAEGNEGAIYAVDRAGNRTRLTLPAGTLPMPGGITATNDALYVSINAGSPGDGKVIRISLR